MHIGLNAHLLSGEAGYRAAGIHGYIDHLLRHLPAALPDGWRVTAMTGAHSPQRYDGIAMRRARWPTASPPLRILWEQLAQPWQLGEFDLLHALAFVAPLLGTKPAVVTVYDLSFIHYPQRLPAARRLYLRLFTALSCRRARRVIVISHSTAADLAETLGIAADKIDVAAPGYDRELFKPLPAGQVAAFREREGLPERFMLFIGTLEPRKNLTTLLAAYARLPESERIPLILGGGKGWRYEEVFAGVERFGLRDSVHFPGFIPTAQLPLWYNSAALFLYPSVFEGFGLPVLEALACGAPVIVSAASSLPEVAGSAGMTAAPHDVAAWAEALHSGLTDTNWHQEARVRGPARAAQYSWETTARQTVAAYGRALSRYT